MQNTLNTLHRDTYITWFTQTMDYVHTKISSPFITVQKDEGIQPVVTLLHFLFMLSQSLSHNNKYCLQFQNTMLNRIIMLFFYRGNTMGKYYGSSNTMGPKNSWPTHIQKNVPPHPWTGMSVQFYGCLLANSFVDSWYWVNHSIFPWYFPYNRNHCNKTVYGFYCIRRETMRV